MTTQEHYENAWERITDALGQVNYALTLIPATHPTPRRVLEQKRDEILTERERLLKCATGEGVAFPLESFSFDDGRWYEVRDADGFLLESFDWGQVKNGSMDAFMERLAQQAEPGKQMSLDSLN